MDLKLKGKIALITGSTAGIGFAIAESLVAEEATVIVNGRSAERVTAAINKIKQKYPQAELIAAVADLSTQAGVDQLIKKIPVVDILVNNVGTYQFKPFTEITDADWYHLFDTNVMSGVRLSRHYLPAMLKKNEGRIIFISSESGLQIPVGMIHYGMTKTAQLAIARGLAEMTAGTHVTVNSVLPGPTRSEGVEQFLSSVAAANKVDEAQIEKEFFISGRPSSLIKRFATAEEVANLVVYVCSPLSSATNGAALRVDGGVVQSIA